MQQHFGDKKNEVATEENDDDESDDNLRDVDDVLKQVDTMLHKRHRIKTDKQTSNDFSDILT